MEREIEPEWVTAKRTEDGRFANLVRGLWLRMFLYVAGLYVSDIAIRGGLVALIMLDLVLLMTLVIAWRAGGLTLGSAGIALSVGAFQLALLARADDEPFANGPLLALSFIFFLASLMLGNRPAKRPSSP